MMSCGHKVIPKLVAKKKGTTFKESFSYVTEEYAKIGQDNANWYRPSFWFEKFGLDSGWDDVLDSMRDRVVVYRDVESALKRLSKHFKLAVLTQSPHESIRFKLEADGIRKYFGNIVSVIDDLDVARKSSQAFLSFLKILNAGKKELVHVGDDLELDYLVPKRLGIRSFYLDRKGKTKSEDTIRSLSQLPKLLEMSHKNVV